MPVNCAFLSWDFTKEGAKVAREETQHTASRREFVKMAAYIAPAIVSLRAAPMYAKAGSLKEIERKQPTQPTQP